MSRLLWIGAILVTVYFSCVSATSPLCYVCHGDYCNDPFNTGKASVVNCSYSSGVNKRSVEDFETDVQNNSLASMESFKDWQSLESKFMGFFFNTDTDYVCVKSTYYNYVQQGNWTIRRCMPKVYKNMDACAQLSSTINVGYGTVQSCLTCDTNLCNAADAATQGVVILFTFAFLKFLL